MESPSLFLMVLFFNINSSFTLGLDLLERKGLFRIYDDESEEQNNAHHLATMTALLGPPPSEFLNRSKETSKYWNKDSKCHRQ